jgi:hypothetical protein
MSLAEIRERVAAEAMRKSQWAKPREVTDCMELLALVDRLARVLMELLAAECTQMPPYEAGKEAQEAWADRRATARNDADAALDSLESAHVHP